MKLFSRKATIIVRSEQQKDDMIEKLESQHLDYDVKEDDTSVAGTHPIYKIRVYADDYAKVV